METIWKFVDNPDPSKNKGKVYLTCSTIYDLCVEELQVTYDSTEDIVRTWPRKSDIPLLLLNYEWASMAPAKQQLRRKANLCNNLWVESSVWDTTFFYFHVWKEEFFAPVNKSSLLLLVHVVETAISLSTSIAKYRLTFLFSVYISYYLYHKKATPREHRAVYM